MMVSLMFACSDSHGMSSTDRMIGRFLWIYVSFDLSGDLGMTKDNQLTP
jgi:hypothetical protein